MRLFVGMDVDPVAHIKARAYIHTLLHGGFSSPNSELEVHTFLKNFRCIKSVLGEVDEELVNSGVHGILMDLGMSSMQVLLSNTL